MFRRFTGEGAIALLTLALTLVGACFVIFGPATISYGTNTFVAASTSVWSNGFDSNGAMYVAALVLAGLLVAAGAYMRSADIGGGLAVLWTGVLILAFGALIALPGNTNAVLPPELLTDTPDSVGIGIYMMPAALMGVFAGIAAAAIHHPHRPVALRPH